MPTDDDRFDDRFDAPRDDAPLGDDEIIRKAKSLVQAPAICLIVLGVIGFVFMPLQIFQAVTMPAQFEKAKADMDSNPQMKDDERKKAKEIVDMIEGPITVAVPISIVIGLVQSAIVLFAGIKMKNLTGSPGFLKMAAFVAILPCSALCCLLNIGFGIWALTTLGKPDVIAGLKAMQRRSVA